MRGYLELLASMPNTAKVFYLEAIAAGPEAVTRRHAVHLRFARNIVNLSRGASHGGEGVELSELHALAVVGALHQIIYGQLLVHGPDSLLEISNEAVQLAVAFLTVRTLPVGKSPSSKPAPPRLAIGRSVAARTPATKPAARARTRVRGCGRAA
jgi:hypothetical protein